MSKPIEDYALIGNCETSALVARDGSIDWMGMPRFDSPSCFSALLGNEDHGRWLVAPVEGGACTSRKYRGDSLILETTFETAEGAVCVVDLMSRGKEVRTLCARSRDFAARCGMRVEVVCVSTTVPWFHG